MLKIIDDFNLEKLKDYGFHKITAYDEQIWYREDIFCGERVEISVNNDKTFDIYWGYYKMCGDEQKRFIIDLIIAGIVEKVSDEDKK